MAKRFEDTELWDKEWFMALSMKHKLLIKFLFSKCDVAGIWSPNYPLASAYIGTKITATDLKNLGSQIDFLSNGKIFVTGFISFQYGTLSENCAPHKKIISLLKKYDLYERVLEGYSKGIDTLKEKEEEKDKDKEEEVEEEKAPPKSKTPKKNVSLLFTDSDFNDFDKFYAAFKNTDYEVFNLRYYYEAVSAWSTSKGEKKIDWIATARGFMLRDQKKNEAVYRPNTTQYEQSATSKRFYAKQSNQGKQSGSDYLGQSIASDLEGLSRNGGNY